MNQIYAIDRLNGGAAKLIRYDELLVQQERARFHISDDGLPILMDMVAQNMPANGTHSPEEYCELIQQMVWDNLQRIRESGEQIQHGFKWSHACFGLYTIQFASGHQMTFSRSVWDCAVFSVNGRPFPTYKEVQAMADDETGWESQPIPEEEPIYQQYNFQDESTPLTTQANEGR